MGHRRLAKKNIRAVRHLGKKSVRVVKHIARKLPESMEKAGNVLQTAGKVGEAASAIIAATGNEEIAAPLLMASEASKYSGKALKGGGKGLGQARDGNVVGGLGTLEKTAIQSRKSKSKFDKKYK